MKTNLCAYHLSPMDALYRRTTTWLGDASDSEDYRTDGKITLRASFLTDAADELLPPGENPLDRVISDEEVDASIRFAAQHIRCPTEIAGQFPVSCDDTDNVAVLRHRPDGRYEHVFVGAHRLLLVQEVLDFDTIYACGFGQPVLFAKGGTLCGCITGFSGGQEVEFNWRRTARPDGFKDKKVFLRVGFDLVDFYREMKAASMKQSP